MNFDVPDIEPVEMSSREVVNVRLRSTIYLIIAILMMALVSCGNWGWESIDTDNEERLNIFGVISLDDSVQSFIIVHKTLDTAGPIDEVVGRDTVYYEAWEYFDYDLNQTVRDTFWYDPPWIRTVYESRYVVKDATVTVSDGQQEYVFERAPVEGPEIWQSWSGDIFSDPAIYLNVDGTFTPQPDTEYSLEISTPSGLSVTGSTRTPFIPQIKEALLPDTVSIKELFEVEWSYQGDYIATVATGIQRMDERYDWICGVEQHGVQEYGDTTWVSTLDTWCLEYPDDGNENTTVPMEIRLRYLDEHYFDYFLASGEVGEISNILLGEGGIAQGYGVEGGFGVFGSISADWTYRVATP